VISSPSSGTMWRKFLAIALIFYALALLQNSFLSHFSLLGSIPNLVFIFFFLLVFFNKTGSIYEMIFWAVLAGFFLDVFSYSYIGPNIILFLVVGYLSKETQLMLKNRNDKFPPGYFISLFLIFLVGYKIFISLFLYCSGTATSLEILSTNLLAGLFYNLIFAMAGFGIFRFIYAKKIQG